LTSLSLWCDHLVMCHLLNQPETQGKTL
jgi:hypothetical protein